jgi:hypothetical protein
VEAAPALFSFRVSGRSLYFRIRVACFANTVELDLDLTQSGNMISSDSTHSVDNSTCVGMHVDSSTGSVSGDTFDLVFSIDSEQITMNATLSAGGKSIVSGKFTPGTGLASVVGPSTLWVRGILPSPDPLLVACRHWGLRLQ